MSIRICAINAEKETGLKPNNWRAYKHSVLLRASFDDSKYKAVCTMLCLISCLDIFLADESDELKREGLKRDLNSAKLAIEDIINE